MVRKFCLALGFVFDVLRLRCGFAITDHLGLVVVRGEGQGTETGMGKGC